MHISAAKAGATDAPTADLREYLQSSGGGSFFGGFFAVFVPTLFDLAGEIRAAGNKLRGQLRTDAGNLTEQKDTGDTVPYRR